MNVSANKNKFVVTGGAGFIGSTIVDRLIELGHEVVVLDDLSTGCLTNVNPLAQFINIDLSIVDPKKLSLYIKDTTSIFHCAALPNVQFSIDYPGKSNAVNVHSMINILEAMRIAGIKKIIYSGSCSVYGNAKNIPTNETSDINPLSPYALQKYVCEEYCYLYKAMYDISYVIFRYFNVYGERMSAKGAYVSVLSHFIQAYRNKKALPITNDGSQKRDFVYVKDVAEANIISALTNQADNSIINLGSGMNYSINTIASWFKTNTIYTEPRIEPKETMADISLANKLLKWEPKQDIRDWIENIL
jgi:UDP-glucose 4-epimerase